MSEDNAADPRPSGMSEGPKSHWEREVLEKVLLESVREQRIARRWGIGLKLAFLAFLSVALWLAFKPFAEPRYGKEDQHTAVIDISGMIADGKIGHVVVQDLGRVGDADAAGGGRRHVDGIVTHAEIGDRLQPRHQVHGRAVKGVVTHEGHGLDLAPLVLGQGGDGGKTGQAERVEIPRKCCGIGVGIGADGNDLWHVFSLFFQSEAVMPPST